MNNAMNGMRPAQLSEQLRQIDFCIVETALFLDAYPDHPQALAYYRQLVGERARIAEQYEKTIGPLTVYGNRDNASWDWVKAPWPWELAANS